MYVQTFVSILVAVGHILWYGGGGIWTEVHAYYESCCLYNIQTVGALSNG
jgi:hypothetical protein